MVSKLAKGRAEARADQREAFTLIELLVVIAIVAILAAMLLPALNRAKIATDGAGCRNNLRQLTLAIGMYVHDYGAYPGYIFHTQATGVRSFFVQLQPYTRAPWPEPNYDQTGWLGPRTSIYACPAYSRVRGGFDQSVKFWSYGYNSAGCTFQGFLGLGGTAGAGPGPTGPTRESAVTTPSDMIAIGDAALAGDSPGIPGLVWGQPNLNDPIVLENFYKAVMQGQPVSDLGVRAMKYRHGGRWIVGFCDGHVESLRPQDLFIVTNAVVAQRWNNDHQPHLDSILFPP
ncbi:MAG TPA: DUF1559 domain-containing protein [Verrucomicrobiae bacterium]|nr:DUF1559 domain-containing protein [Verrucomicrobiae bacterium]